MLILECLDLVDHPDDGGKGCRMSRGAMHLARRSPAEGGESEMVGDVMEYHGRAVSQPLPLEGIWKVWVDVETSHQQYDWYVEFKPGAKVRPPPASSSSSSSPHPHTRRHPLD
ncbi:hypothetical protein Tco_1004000 [Tanacetum coccineum]|uniref:DUF3859 domain-containing protein n=1 Tax=Tanacetum coccineum TaxID=301880 RepID=A0ABQ5FB59_9ASTR